MPKAGPGWDELEYEAYDAKVEPRLRQIAEEARIRWSGVGRVVIWHRSGTLAVGETSVAVAVSAAHRRGRLRRRPLLHRHGEDDGSHLEAGALG